MKRYLNSFFISFFIYALGFGAFFYFTFNTNTQRKKSQEIQTISISHFEIKKPVLETKAKLEKRVVKKEITPKKKEKIVKKKAIKKINKKKVITKKKIVTKKELKDFKKIIRKVEQQTQNKTTKKKVEPLAQNRKKIEKKPNFKQIQKNYLDKNLNLIGKLIQKSIVYPKRARRFGIEDIVKVKFKLLKNGEIDNIVFLKGHKLLKKSTLNAIKNSYKNFPKVNTNITVEVPIQYKLI